MLLVAYVSDACYHASVEKQGHQLPCYYFALCCKAYFTDQPQRLRKPEVFERSIFSNRSAGPRPVGQEEEQEQDTDIKFTRWYLSKHKINYFGA